MVRGEVGRGEVGNRSGELRGEEGGVVQWGCTWNNPGTSEERFRSENAHGIQAQKSKCTWKPRECLGGWLCIMAEQQRAYAHLQSRVPDLPGLPQRMEAYAAGHASHLQLLAQKQCLILREGKQQAAMAADGTHSCCSAPLIPQQGSQACRHMIPSITLIPHCTTSPAPDFHQVLPLPLAPDSH